MSRSNPAWPTYKSYPKVPNRKFERLHETCYPHIKSPNAATKRKIQKEGITALVTKNRLIILSTNPKNIAHYKACRKDATRWNMRLRGRKISVWKLKNNAKDYKLKIQKVILKWGKIQKISNKLPGYKSHRGIIKHTNGMYDCIVYHTQRSRELQRRNQWLYKSWYYKSRYLPLQLARELNSIGHMSRLVQETDP